MSRHSIKYAYLILIAWSGVSGTIAVYWTVQLVESGFTKVERIFIIIFMSLFIPVMAYLWPSLVKFEKH